MNNITLVGNLVNDPKVVEKNNFIAAHIRVAVNGFRNGKTTTDYINCTGFGKDGTVIKDNLKKGDRVGVIGELVNSDYEKDGQKMYSYEVYIRSLEFMGKAKTESPQQ